MRHLPTRTGVALVAALALISSLDAAPAPIPRAPRAGPLAAAGLTGEWTMRWNGVVGTITLSPDGAYSCVWCGVRFVGTWKVENGRLWVHETHDPRQTGNSHRYSVTLDPATLTGRAASGGDQYPIQLQKRRGVD